MPESQKSPSLRPPLLEWLVHVNHQVSGWAASMTWWRLIIFFLVLLIAGSIVSEQLHLRHDKMRVKRTGNDSVEVQIFGPEGIRIHKGGRTRALPGASAPASSSDEGEGDGNPETIKVPVVPPVPAVPGAASAPGAKTVITDDDDDEDRVVTQKVWTVRGLIGDLGAVLLTIVFAYLVASKIVVRKVAESNAKVRSAVSAAEHEAMERQLVQARLQVLQAQVEPHFLFNTLAAVDYLIETDPPRASQMQKALITYLRGALPQMRLETSTVGRELRLIRSYLDLIKMRIEDRLEVEFAVPEGAESAEFPPMMLQSLVENAIKHGIEPKPEGGKVTVAARIQNGQLWVEVKDTGIGIADTSRLEGPTSGTGIGLQNIRERLAMLYPGKSRLILVSDDHGTSVKIVVPYQVGPEAAARFDGVGEEKPA